GFVPSCAAHVSGMFVPSQFSLLSSMPLPQVVWQFAHVRAVALPTPTSQVSPYSTMPLGQIDFTQVVGLQSEPSGASHVSNEPLRIVQVWPAGDSPAQSLFIVQLTATETEQLPLSRVIPSSHLAI